MSKLDEILELVRKGGYADSIEYMEVQDAKQAIYQAGMDMIGEDDVREETHIFDKAIMHRNQLRQEMRIKWKEYCGNED